MGVTFLQDFPLNVDRKSHVPPTVMLAGPFLQSAEVEERRGMVTPWSPFVSPCWSSPVHVFVSAEEGSVLLEILVIMRLHCLRTAHLQQIYYDIILQSACM